METSECALRRVHIARVAGFFVRPHQHGNSLPLRQPGVPRSSESVAVFPIEVVVPDCESLRILLEVRDQPVGAYEEFLAARWIGAAAKEVVICQAILRDGNGVVLQADLAVVVELRNAGRIVMPLIVRLLGEQHVVLAEVAAVCMRIRCGSFVPEGQLALATEKVGTEDAAVIIETRQ